MKDYPGYARRIAPASIRSKFRGTPSIRLLRSWVFAFTLPGLALAGQAQAIEVAPFAGQRYGGSFKDANSGADFRVADAATLGLTLDFDLAPDQQIEVFLSRQNTNLATAGLFTGNPLLDLTIDYYHIGGLYILPEIDRVSPFVSGTFGLTRMAPGRAGLTTENRLSLSLGGGAKVFFNKSFGLRFDARGIYTMLNSDSAVFCSGGCTIRVKGSGFVQTEVGAALMLRF